LHVKLNAVNSTRHWKRQLKISANLDDSRFIQNGMSNRRLEALHLLQHLDNFELLEIHQAKGRHVHAVIFEILQIERFYVLQKRISLR